MKPNFIKEQQGTLENSRTKTPALESDLIPLPPEDFTKKQEKMWGLTWNFLLENGVNNPVDYYQIKRYVEFVSWEQDLIKDLKKEQLVIEVTNNKGKTNPGKNPKAMILMDIVREIGTIEKQLGIGVLNRDKINWKPERGGDDDGIR